MLMQEKSSLEVFEQEVKVLPHMWQEEGEEKDHNEGHYRQNDLDVCPLIVACKKQWSHGFPHSHSLDLSSKEMNNANQEIQIQEASTALDSGLCNDNRGSTGIGNTTIEVNNNTFEVSSTEAAVPSITIFEEEESIAFKHQLLSRKFDRNAILLTQNRSLKGAWKKANLWFYGILEDGILYLCTNCDIDAICICLKCDSSTYLRPKYGVLDDKVKAEYLNKGFSEEHLKALNANTQDSWYKHLNTKLTQSFPSERLRKHMDDGEFSDAFSFARLLHDAICLANETFPVLYRGTDSKLKGGFRIGERFSFLRFTSTSKDKNVAEYFVDPYRREKRKAKEKKKGTLFTFLDCRGIYVERLSAYENQHEVLLSALDVFCVTEIINGDVDRVTMIQIPN